MATLPLSALCYFTNMAGKFFKCQCSAWTCWVVSSHSDSRSSVIHRLLQFHSCAACWMLADYSKQTTPVSKRVEMAPSSCHLARSEWVGTRRLATANRSRVSIRGQPRKNLPQILVWSPCKIWLLFLILCARMYEIPKFEMRWGPTHPLGRRRGWCPRNIILPTHVTTPNFVALGQTVWASVEVPKILETLGPSPLWWGRSWPLETCFSPPVLPCQLTQIRSF